MWPETLVWGYKLPPEDGHIGRLSEEIVEQILEELGVRQRRK